LNRPTTKADPDLVMDTDLPTCPLLIFAYGNPSRGDDALGPELLQRLQRQGLPEQTVELLGDFQLQIEHALDLVGRQRVLFIDASLDANRPFSFERIQPQRDQSFTSHALSPAALLHVYQQLQQQPPPPCYLLAIRGYGFELGQSISHRAEANLELGLKFIEGVLYRGQDPEQLLETGGR